MITPKLTLYEFARKNTLFIGFPAKRVLSIRIHDVIVFIHYLGKHLQKVHLLILPAFQLLPGSAVQESQ